MPRTQLHLNKPLITGLCILVACCCSLAVHAQAQADWSAKVLAHKDPAKKEQLVCVSGNKGVPTKTLARLIAREKHGPAVAAAAGMYFENGQFDADTPELIRQIAKRPDIGSQAMAYAALSPMAVDLIMGLASSKSKGDQQIAARILAATAAMRRGSDRAKQHPSEKVAGAPNNRLYVNYKNQLETLLNEADDEATLELVLLTVGLDRNAGVKDAIAQHAKSRDQALAMVAQFALASTKQPVDEEAVIKAVRRVDRRAKPRPALSYDPRQTARIYAIMAAGEARLADASEPLLELVADKDLHTAVYATRALSRIGGEGLSVKLIESMNEDTPWPVRVAVYDAAGFNPEKAAVALLRERYREERGRFRQDALYALLSIAAGAVEGNTIEAFDAWWNANSETFKVDRAETRKWRGPNKIADVQVEPVAGFYESAVISDRPVFSVDASLSMKGAQIESLKQTLNDVVSSFPERVKFNIVDFGGHVRTLAAGGMIPAKNRRQAMEEFTYDMELTLGTRTYDAIERAMGVPGMDTVHFLSDGAPYGSHVKSWQRIEYITRLYCSTAPVAVHVLHFPNPGAAGKGGGHEQMKRYARANAGAFGVVRSDAEPKK